MKQNKQQEKYDEIEVCSQCESHEVGEKFAGDEGWTICDECHSVEQGYVTRYICNTCGDEHKEEKKAEKCC